MFKAFMPKSPAFSDHFQQFNQCIREMTALFSEFIGAFNDFENYYLKAKAIEHRGDNITHKIINELNSTFITPFDREDIYALAQEMDDLVDLFEKTMQTVYLYQISAKRDGVDYFVVLMVKAANTLDRLITETFKRQRHTSDATELMKEIHDLEDQGDALYQKVIRQLFTAETDPIMIIKWREIYDSLEAIMDKFQSISDTIESIVVKSN